MAIPVTGEVKASQINVELGRSSTATLSIDSAENGVYAAINENSSARPSPVNPARYSEWLGYDHNATPAPTLAALDLGFSSVSSATACFNFTNNPTQIWGSIPFDYSNWYTVSIYVETAGTYIPAPAGDYSANNSYRYWNGSSWVGGLNSC